jgi:hypothetical protein
MFEQNLGTTDDHVWWTEIGYANNGNTDSWSPFSFGAHDRVS